MYTPQYISDEKPKKFGKICTAQMYSPDGAIYNYRKHQNAPFYLSFLDFCTTRIYVTHLTVASFYRVAQKKVDHHAACGHNLRKLLLNNAFILVECRCRT